MEEVIFLEAVDVDGAEDAPDAGLGDIRPREIPEDGFRESNFSNAADSFEMVFRSALFPSSLSLTRMG